MNKAIEASLSEGLSAEVAAKKPLEEQIRKGETYVVLSTCIFSKLTHCDVRHASPVALRVTNPRLVYAAMMLHALYFVPQVRKAICDYFPSPESQNGEDAMAGPDPSAPLSDGEPGPFCGARALAPT